MKTRSNRAPCCKNCHFLAKATVSVNGARHLWSWNEQERSDRRVNERDAAQCAQGVWDTGIDPHLNSRLAACRTFGVSPLFSMTALFSSKL